MDAPLHRFERIDIIKAIFWGFIFDIIAMFGIWPAAGEPLPTGGQLFLLIFTGFGFGLVLLVVAKVRRRRNGFIKRVPDWLV